MKASTATPMVLFRLVIYADTDDDNDGVNDESDAYGGLSDTDNDGRPSTTVMPSVNQHFCRYGSRR